MGLRLKVGQNTLTVLMLVRFKQTQPEAGMVELVDRADLKSVEIHSRVGSSPTIRTNTEGRSFNG